MVEQLFGSKTRVKLLQLFYSNPSRSFYVREITRKIDEQINSVRRELANLLSIGLISSENNNNKLYYEVNKNYQYYRSLSEIFSDSAAAAATAEDMEPKDDQIRALGNVEAIILTGKFTRDLRSGVDIILIGDLNQTQVNKYIAEMEKKEGREMIYTTMKASEFEYRKKLNDRFITNVLDSKKQVLIDRNNLLDEKDKKQAARE